MPWPCSVHGLNASPLTPVTGSPPSRDIASHPDPNLNNKCCGGKPPESNCPLAWSRTGALQAWLFKPLETRPLRGPVPYFLLDQAQRLPIPDGSGILFFNWTSSRSILCAAGTPVGRTGGCGHCFEAVCLADTASVWVICYRLIIIKKQKQHCSMILLT